jgi:coenzyme F420 hydrogenase subunit beta
MLTKNISSIIKDQLCTGCGTCIALCPNKAISLSIDMNKGIYVPRIDDKKCNACGFCYKICPGHEIKFKQLNYAIFGKKPKNILLGNYIGCYAGYATDYCIRYNGSSGGLVTTLLINLLKKREIDGALVTRMSKDRPLEAESFIARTPEEIYEGRGSKYCPVPANLALKDIIEAKDSERFAVVGLPCQICGIRSAEYVNKKMNNPALSDGVSAG